MASDLTIGELARTTGVRARTIRFYEEVGALPRPRRTANGYRRYTQQTVDRLLFLRRARALGLSLAQSRALAYALDGPSAAFRPRLREHIQSHLVTVQQQIDELVGLRRQLEQVLERLASAGRRANGRGRRPDRCSCLELNAAPSSP